LKLKDHSGDDKLRRTYRCLLLFLCSKSKSNQYENLVCIPFRYSDHRYFDIPASMAFSIALTSSYSPSGLFEDSRYE
jgi:hypothetical protein